MQIKQHSFTITQPLTAVGPGTDLFIAGASIFEIPDFEPPLQRVTVVGINLPDPDTFGPFNSYIATLTIPNEVAEELASFILEPTPDLSVWAGIFILDFGGTLPPINASVRPGLNGERIGPVILQGSVLGEQVNEIGTIHPQFR